MSQFRQLVHHEIHNCSTQSEIVLWVDVLHSSENIAGVFRTAEAMGVKTIFWHKPLLNLYEKKIVRASRHTTHYIQSILCTDYLILETLKKRGYQLIALEICQNATNIYQFQSSKPMVLLIGNESKGLQKMVLKHCDSACYIPMYGQNTSMNVVVALGIALSVLRWNTSEEINILK